MNEELNTTTKQIGEALITMSASLDANMEKWSDASARPADLSIAECVGFSSKEPDGGLTLLIDVLAPADKEEATLRTWAIQSEPDNNQVERFNNIQLDFTVGYRQARELAQKGGEVTRDDIRTLLNDPSTKPAHVIVSNQSGFDEASQQTLGERYDVTVGEPAEGGASTAQVTSALQAVLSTLQKTALTPN